jgi:hypothetical protein
MIGALYTALLLAAAAYVFWRGGSEERAFIVTLFAVSFGTFLIVSRLHARFDEFNMALVANESILLCVTLLLAYRSNRFWPLPVASLELAAFLSLLVPLYGKNLVSYALGVAQGMWAYLQLTIVVVAVVRGRNRSHSSPT